MTDHYDKQRLLEAYWGTLDEKDPKQAVSLNDENSRNEREFFSYGCRLGHWLADRMDEHGTQPLMQSNVLEIGCGMGRLLFPLCSRFLRVSGVDMSAEVLAAARAYLGDIPNYDLFENNGHDLAFLADASYDYVLTSGVLQHVIDFPVIAGYLREALRVLRPEGTFVFSFQAWLKHDQGQGRVGAKITADKLTAALADLDYDIREINYDPADPVPHYCVVLRKAAGQKDFATVPVRELPWRSLLWEGFETLPGAFERSIKRPMRITFND